MTAVAGQGAVARGSSFYLGMRLLPKDRREAMFAVYAFCRAVDDIADDIPLAGADRRAGLARWRADIEALYAGTASGAPWLAAPIDRFGLEKDDFLAVIDGMEMDVAGTAFEPDFATLDLYCDRVASAVGRLSVRVFGMAREPGIELSHHLGRALQLTNILRDLDEDAGIGRLYLPREALDGAGIPPGRPAERLAHPAIDQACRPVAARARRHYAGADAVLRTRPAGHLLAPRLMRDAYGPLLDRMEAAGWAPPRRRPAMSKTRLLWLLLRQAFGA